MVLKAELEEKKKRAKVALDLAVNNLHVAVEGIYVDSHPRSVVKQP